VLWILNQQDDGARTDGSIISDKDLLTLARERELNFWQHDIADMTGIKYFAGLQSLDCSYNQLTTLDLSGNRALQTLCCEGNRLSVLDVSKNAALLELVCGGNLLTSLDVSQNAALWQLGCGENLLTSLDVSKNTALISLYCSGNQLSMLNVSANAALVALRCGGNSLTVLDISKNPALDWLECGNNQLSVLNISANAALRVLNCNDNKLTALNISQNVALWHLDCTKNYMISPADVMGWQKSVLVFDSTFFFYPQKISGGFTVSGLVKSYNPQHCTYLALCREGEAEAAYTCTIEKENSGSGQWEQPFSFPAVEPGTYTLTITKAAHTKFTVHNIVVADKEVDLTQDGRPEVQLMTMRCGDINGDGNINNSDLTILWQQANYNRSAAAAANELCDLNGDGLINNIDLTILWLAYNYNRGGIEIN
jgi:hypothetical protein